ncbi:MAG TPA: metallophosphoesterase family protein [Bryobacteraceae bacterium]|nr:metallophosphoesterase family protein [Bryobacteraceae bacterium]
MRTAIVSDIHGNRFALEAVLTDLRETSPDLILHGGDLPHGGSSPAEIVDCIRGLGWPGVLGNTDEMLFQPESLAPLPPALLKPIQEMAAATCEALGEERIAWLSGLPLTEIYPPIALVHASPESSWRSPTPESTDAELESVYGPLGQPIAVYGHIHRSYIRTLAGLTVINTGSVSLSYDGDPRAAYLLLDDSEPTIRRVEYDVDKEIKALYASGLPHADWIAKSFRTALPQMP